LKFELQVGIEANMERKYQLKNQLRENEFWDEQIRVIQSGDHQKLITLKAFFKTQLYTSSKLLEDFIHHER